MNRRAALRVFRSAPDRDFEVHRFIPGMWGPTYAVIADVLRATTSMIHAFANGARSARFWDSIEEARTDALAWRDLPRESRPLLCGEFAGRKVHDFDLGNSPSEFDAARVKGRDLIVATTNGAAAIHRTAEASHQFLVAFVNLSAAADALLSLVRRNASSPGEVLLVAAGSMGFPCAEDDALVGALAARLLARAPGEFELVGEDPRPLAVPAGFDPATGLPTHGPGRARAALEEFLRATTHGRVLLELGPEFADDLRAAADLDRFTRLPFGRGATIGPGLDVRDLPAIPLF